MHPISSKRTTAPYPPQRRHLTQRDDAFSQEWGGYVCKGSEHLQDKNGPENEQGGHAWPRRNTVTFVKQVQVVNLNTEQ